MDRQRGPQPELRLRKLERRADRRKNQQGDGIQNKNRAERNRHLFFIGVENWPDGGDGAAAANGRARSNQKGRIAANFEEFPECKTCQQRKGNSERGVNKSAAPRFQYFVEIHAEAQRYYGTLQKCPRNATAFADEGMLEAETEKNSCGERDRRRKKSRERKGQRQDKE